MYGDELIGWITFIVVFVGLVSLVGGAVLVDTIRQRSYEKLQKIKSTNGDEIKPITKKEAIYLIKKCSENPKHDLELLDRGTHYFIYSFSHEGWIDVAKIDTSSLLITREFKVNEEIKNEKLNLSSRLLIFNEYGTERQRKKNLNKTHYILRLVWAIGKVEKDKELLTSVYEREEFKQFIERYEYQLKEPWTLSDDFLRQSQIQKILQEDSLAYITTIRSSGLLDRNEKHKMTFKLYDAIDGYQVITKIPGIAS